MLMPLRKMSYALSHADAAHVMPAYFDAVIVEVLPDALLMPLMMPPMPPLMLYC